MSNNKNVSEQELNENETMNNTEQVDLENANADETVEQTEESAEEESAAPAEEEAPKEKTLEDINAELQKQVEDLKSQQLYKIAEFDNFRKRVMQEKAELIKNGGSKVISTLLPIVDDLERAQQNMDKYEDVAAVREGLNLIIDKFFKLLATEGLKKMEVNGCDFDADFHEAVAMVPGMPADQKGKVIDCVTPGYLLNDKVIRYAKVAVAE